MTPLLKRINDFISNCSFNEGLCSLMIIASSNLHLWATLITFQEKTWVVLAAMCFAGSELPLNYQQCVLQVLNHKHKLLEAMIIRLHNPSLNEHLETKSLILFRNGVTWDLLLISFSNYLYILWIVNLDLILNLDDVLYTKSFVFIIIELF